MINIKNNRFLSSLNTIPSFIAFNGHIFYILEICYKTIMLPDNKIWRWRLLFKLTKYNILICYLFYKISLSSIACTWLGTFIYHSRNLQWDAQVFSILLHNYSYIYIFVNNYKWLSTLWYIIINTKSSLFLT